MCIREFTKEELLFLKQFPRLFALCSYKCTGVTRLELKKIYIKVIKAYSMDKETFENSIRMILFRIDYDGCNFKEGSYGKYYYDLYTSLGVMFKDTEGNIKLKFS
jgi:hypothetical protein